MKAKQNASKLQTTSDTTLDDNKCWQIVEQMLDDAIEKSDYLIHVTPVDDYDGNLCYSISVNVPYGAHNSTLAKAIKEAKALRSRLFDCQLLELPSADFDAIAELENSARLLYEKKTTYRAIAETQRKTINDLFDELLLDGKITEDVFFTGKTNYHRRFPLVQKIMQIMKTWGYSVRGAQALINEAVKNYREGLRYFADNEPID